jgi:hypothetical protein
VTTEPIVHSALGNSRAEQDIESESAHELVNDGLESILLVPGDHTAIASRATVVGPLLPVKNSPVSASLNSLVRPLRGIQRLLG